MGLWGKRQGGWEITTGGITGDESRMLCWSPWAGQGLILLLCDAGPPQASRSPICEMGSSYREDKWRSRRPESYVMSKRVDSGDRLPGPCPYSFSVRCLSLDHPNDLTQGLRFSHYEMGNNNT